MFESDFNFDIPTGCSLLAEIGIDPSAVRELAEDERAIRCPERGAVYPAYGFASLAPELSPGQAAEPWGPASSFPPAG